MKYHLDAAINYPEGDDEDIKPIECDSQEHLERMIRKIVDGYQTMASSIVLIVVPAS